MKGAITKTVTVLTVPLHRLAHGRTGDKGNRSNISVIAWHPALWDVLVDQDTEEAVARQFAERWPSQVTRHVLPKLHAMNFLLDGVLEVDLLLHNAGYLVNKPIETIVYK